MHAALKAPDSLIASLLSDVEAPACTGIAFDMICAASSAIGVVGSGGMAAVAPEGLTRQRRRTCS
jgi:hypothetical protein